MIFVCYFKMRKDIYKYNSKKKTQHAEVSIVWFFNEALFVCKLGFCDSASLSPNLNSNLRALLNSSFSLIMCHHKTILQVLLRLHITTQVQ
jgi:hypothetical protein